jgi:hypothetical protein
MNMTFLVAHTAYSWQEILGSATANDVEATTDLTTDKLIVGWTFSSPVDNWQLLHSDDILSFTIHVTERREAAQTAGFRLKPGYKSQVGSNHEIIRDEPPTPNP